MKIVYAGSPEYAVASLQAILQAGYEVVAVVTQPDKPTGRKRILTPTAVKAFALSNGLPVFDFDKIREHAEELSALGADIMITCAYGQLLTEKVLGVFPMGVYNLHASLLPQLRGASPIQSAILQGLKYTGVTVMKTVLALDAGDILLSKKIEIGNETAAQLSEKLSSLSAEAAVEALEILKKGTPVLTPQDGAQATFCKKITKEEAKIDFALSAKQVANVINAYSPSPAAFAFLNGAAINLLSATPCDGTGECGTVISADKKGVVIVCGSGAVCVKTLQFSGGKPLTAADAANGRKIKAGDRLD